MKHDLVAVPFGANKTRGLGNNRFFSVNMPACEQRKALSHRLLAPGVDIGLITDIDGDRHGGSGSVLNHFRLLRAESRPVSRAVRVVVSVKLDHKKEKLGVTPVGTPTLNEGREE
jgi:hypothetical protein